MPAARIEIRVSPGASSTGLAGRYGAGWKIRVAAPPERGRANAALVAYLADVLGVERERVRIVVGAAGRSKLVEVEGLTAEAVDATLSAL